jgi:opacity protein-like surface antigen
MNQKTILKSLVLAAVAALGLGVSARADGTSASAPAAALSSLGLLGQTYAGVSYSYVHLDSSPVSADRYSFEYNQPLAAGLDAIFNYDRTQAGLLAGDRGYTQAVDASLRAFSTAYTWGKPYIEAGIGAERAKFLGVKDDSLAWIAGAGIEFHVAQDVTVTPFIRYTRTNGFADRNTADVGVKANYWLTKQLAVTGALSRDDAKNVSYKLGINVRF